ARTRPSLAHAAGAPGWLGDRPGGRVAVEARHGVAVIRGDVDALSVRAHRDPERPVKPVAVGAGAQPVLADAAGGAGGLGEVAGHGEGGRGDQNEHQASQRECGHPPAHGSPEAREGRRTNAGGPGTRPNGGHESLLRPHCAFSATGTPITETTTRMVAVLTSL